MKKSKLILQGALAGFFIICSTGYDDKMTKKIAEFKGKVLLTS